MLEEKKTADSSQVIDLENKIILLEEERRQAIDESQANQEEAMKLKVQMDKKVNSLTQVNNMKTMIQNKNKEIKELRERLGKYENLDDD